MRSYKFIQLFRLIFGKNPKPDLKKIEAMGLLAVKIGQMYALRSDFLAPEKCQHLAQLYESTTAVPTQDFDTLFEKDASDSLKRVLKQVDPTPLASASIGQVHLGKLETGEMVAIKIIKGDFKAEFLKDVEAVRSALKKILIFYPKLKKVADPMGTLETIERLTLKELELTNEIKGIRRLTQIKDINKQKFPYLEDLHFPQVFSHLSNNRVFVSEFIDGTSFRSLLEDNKLSYDTLLKIFRIHGFYLFLQGEFHGDLHPGNVFLRGDQIVFLDNSNIEEVPTRFGKGIVKLLFYLAEAKWKKAAHTLHSISKVQISRKKYQKFEAQFLDLYKNFDQKTVSEVSLTQKMMETVKLAVNSGMEFENGMFSVIKTLMYLDGMVMKCNPEAILLKDVARFRKDFEGS